MITHLVLFRPKPGLSNENLRLFAQSFRRVCADVPGISRVRVGPVVGIKSTFSEMIGHSVETDSLVAAYLEFENRQALERYLNHPVHEEFSRLFWAYCDGTVVADAAVSDPLKSDLEDVFGLKT